MDITTIFQRIFSWGIFALVGGITVLLIVGCGYFIYQKVFHGKRVITRRQIISASLLCCWLLLVLGLTWLSRGANFNGSFNLELMSGYISAWNHWSISELQLIVFNILMFMPLGFLLPLIWKKTEKPGVAMAISFCLTGLIEVTQLLTGAGIFELDDLFHNVLGSLFGYFCSMAILTLIREKKFRWAPLIRALSIPCLIGVILGGVIIAYHCQPYGNMSVLPAIKQDMSEVQVVAEKDFSDESSAAAIFKSKFAEDKTYLESIRLGLEKLEGLTFSGTARRENENLGYLGTNADGRACRILFFYRTGEWNYTTFPENITQLGENTARQMKTRYEN